MAENVVETAARLAELLLASRVDAVRELARAGQAEAEAQRAWEAASRRRSAAWAAAVKSGWDEADLLRLKFTPPGRRGPGRPRRQRGAGGAAVESAPVEESGEGGLSAVS